MAVIVDQNKKKAEIDPNKAMNPTIATNPSAMSQTPAQQKTPSSGQFTNLKNYLQGNVKAGQTIASKLLGTVEPTKAAAQKDIQATQQAGQDIESQTQKFKQGAQAVSSFLTPGSTETSFQNPQTAFNTNQIMTGQVDTGLGNAQQRAAQATSNLATLSEKNRMLAGESGRQELLKNLYNSPNYRAGLSTLDQAFLQQQAGQKVQEATKGLKQFETQQSADLGKYLRGAQQKSEAFGQTASETSKKLQEQLGKSAQEIDTAQQKQLTDINAKVKRANELVTQWASGNLNPLTLSDEDSQLFTEMAKQNALQSYGEIGAANNQMQAKMTPVTNIYSPSAYRTWGAADPIQVTQGENYGLKDVTSKQEIDRINALRQLAGGSGLLNQYQEVTGADESALNQIKTKIDTSNIAKARDTYYANKQAYLKEIDQINKYRAQDKADIERKNKGQAFQVNPNVIDATYDQQVADIQKKINALPLNVMLGKG